MQQILDMGLIKGRLARCQHVWGPLCGSLHIAVPACLSSINGPFMLGSAKATKHSALVALLVIYSRLPPAALRCIYCNKHQKEKESARSGSTALAVHAMPGRRVYHLVKGEWVFPSKELSTGVPSSQGILRMNCTRYGTGSGW